MKQQLDDVKEFHKRAGARISTNPFLYPDTELKLFRIDLIAEELLEFTRALGCELEIKEDKLKAFEERTFVNPTEAFDAIVDILYVVYGAAISLGFASSLEEGWKEVQRSNMSKFIDGHRREDGKWEKGKSYSPPNLTPILQNKMHNGEQQ